MIVISKSVNLQHYNKKFNTYDLSGEYGVGWTRNGYEFYFDKADYDIIKDYCWHKHQDGYLRTCYGKTNNGGNAYILMHRLILFGFNKTVNQEIDHINGKTNDNRRENMRVVTHSQNMKNVKLSNRNTSGHKGVHFNKLERKYKAYIRVDKRQINLGTFKCYEDAVKARESAEEKYYKELSRTQGDLANGTR